MSYVSAATNTVTDTIGAGSPSDVCLLDGDLWVPGAAAGTILRIDPRTHRRRTIALGATTLGGRLRRGRRVDGRRLRPADGRQPRDELGAAQRRRRRRRRRGRGRGGRGVGREPAQRHGHARGPGARRRDGDRHGRRGRRAGRASPTGGGARLGRQPPGADARADRPGARRRDGAAAARQRAARARAWPAAASGRAVAATGAGHRGGTLRIAMDDPIDALNADPPRATTSTRGCC